MIKITTCSNCGWRKEFLFSDYDTLSDFDKMKRLDMAISVMQSELKRYLADKVDDTEDVNIMRQAIKEAIEERRLVLVNVNKRVFD